MSDSLKVASRKNAAKKTRRLSRKRGELGPSGLLFRAVQKPSGKLTWPWKNPHLSW